MVDVVVENVGEKRAGATKRMRIVRRVKTWRGQRNRGYELQLEAGTEIRIKSTA
jgi:hypothetical protein